MYKPYTGVGSRKTPKEILAIMAAVARELESRGFTLRSGGADGADKTFEAGVQYGNKEIFYANQATQQAMEIASSFHPAWHKCSEYARKLHGRNAFQVLGQDLQSPSKFLLCWTPDGCIDHASRKYQTGGTGTAISIASANNIPIFNLQREDHKARLLKLIKGEE